MIRDRFGDISKISIELHPRLIFNLVIPFVEIILQTSLCLLEEEDEEDSVTPVFMNGGKGKRTTEKYARSAIEYTFRILDANLAQFLRPLNC